MSQSANSGANTLRKPTILVVEDDPSWHLLYKLWFEPKYQIIIATSFATAIGPLLNQEPVVVITDLKLEDPLEPENRHGRHILNVAYALSIPTIVVSGLLTESLRTQLPIYYGVVYVLDKVANEEVPPFSHRLKTCVEKITSGATTRKPTPSSKEGDHKDDWGKLVSQAHFWESVGDILTSSLKCVEDVVKIIELRFEQRVKASGLTEENQRWQRDRLTELQTRYADLKSKIMEAHPDRDIISLIHVANKECTQWKADFSTL